MADEITNRSFSKYSPFFSNFPSVRVKSRATLGFSAMTSVLPICKVRFVRLPNSDRDSKGQPYRWQLICCSQGSVAATLPLELFTLPDQKTRPKHLPAPDQKPQSPSPPRPVATERHNRVDQ